MTNKYNPGDWIKVGHIDAVICKSYQDNPSRYEVVYLDNRDQAINEDVLFINNQWNFEIQGPSGGYADKNHRLSEFVSILRKGRNPR